MTKKKFDFYDIILAPEVITDINSRYEDIDLGSTLPLFTAPMDSVVDLKNINEFLNNKINVVLPRTISFIEYYTTPNINYANNFISFGLGDIKLLLDNNNVIYNINSLYKNQKILIDVANGHMKIIVDLCKQIKKIRPDIIIMVGNIANPKTYQYYLNKNCVDYIRCGIGNGNGCLTTKNSTIGYPLASLISEINEIKLKYKSRGKIPYVVADGGMKDYSDIILALALGADFVMVGSIFNKAIESCGNNYLWKIKLNRKLAIKLFDMGLPIKKRFRGMSTKSAQKAMGKKILKTSEGIVTYRKAEYHIKGWVENLDHYLRTAMSYTNKKNLKEFIGLTKFKFITKNAYDRFNK